LVELALVVVTGTGGGPIVVEAVLAAFDAAAAGPLEDVSR
jgi:hypothetical protein